MPLVIDIPNILSAFCIEWLTVSQILLRFPLNLFLRWFCNAMAAFFFTKTSASSSVYPIILCLLSKHAERLPLHFPIFMFNIPHQAHSLTRSALTRCEIGNLNAGISFRSPLSFGRVGFLYSETRVTGRVFIAFIQKG